MTTILNDDDLLAAVQRRPVIYDRHKKGHCNRDVLKRLWIEISEETGVDVPLCKTRWNSMRDYFSRKYREGMRPGQPVQNGKRVWPYFNLLAFLVPHLHSKREFNGDDQMVDTKEESLFDEEDSCADTGSGATTEKASSVKVKVSLSRSPSPADSDTNLTMPSLTPSAPRTSSVFNNKGSRRVALTRKRRGNKSNPVSDHRPVKVVKREDNSNEHFFKSLLPLLEKLSDLDTLMFRSEVNDLVLKYLQKETPTPQKQPQESAAGDQGEEANFDVYLQQSPHPSPE